MPLQFELTTPERIVLKAEYDSVTLPTQAGEITVLPGHIPLVSNLLPCFCIPTRGYAPPSSQYSGYQILQQASVISQFHICKAYTATR